MAYEVLARKWRPRQFDDVVGQEHVTRTLRNAIETDRLAHAYLFVGPRGIGKTSMARIFAKALNCAKGSGSTPCDKCDSCLEIAAGTNLDVLEIDGASNNRVDEIRELRETVKFTPSGGKFRIYIIDEVHMLTVSAFNALLKTLEEPPPHVKFIFCTTEPDKILATILSRCQRFDFRRIPVGLIVERLELIAKSENMKVQEDAMLAIARGSDGGLRDAESALDQLVSFCGEKISEEDVLSVFGLVARGTLEKLAAMVLEGDVAGLIRTVAELDESGKDLQRLVLELMGHFRDLLVCLHVDSPSEILDLMAGQVEVLKAQAASTNAGRAIRVAGILAEAEERMKNALSKRTLLETSLIRCARAASVVSIDEILAKINSIETGQPRTASPELPAVSAEEEPAKATAKVREATAQYVARAASESELRLLSEKWSEVIDRAAKVSVVVRSSLVDARPIAVEGDMVTIAFETECASEQKNLEVPRNRKALEHALGNVVRRDVRVAFTTQEGVVTQEIPNEGEPAVSAPPEEGGAGEEPAGKTTKSDGKRRKKTHREWADDPSVQQALDMFNGTIVEVRE